MTTRTSTVWFRKQLRNSLAELQLTVQCLQLLILVQSPIPTCAIPTAIVRLSRSIRITVYY